MQRGHQQRAGGSSRHIQRCRATSNTVPRSPSPTRASWTSPTRVTGCGGRLSWTAFPVDLGQISSLLISQLPQRGHGETTTCQGHCWDEALPCAQHPARWLERGKHRLTSNCLPMVTSVSSSVILRSLQIPRAPKSLCPSSLSPAAVCHDVPTPRWLPQELQLNPLSLSLPPVPASNWDTQDTPSPEVLVGTLSLASLV